MFILLFNLILAKILKGVSSLSMSASTVSSESEEKSGDRGNEQQKTLIGEHFAPIEVGKSNATFPISHCIFLL